MFSSSQFCRSFFVTFLSDKITLWNSKDNYWKPQANVVLRIYGFRGRKIHFGGQRGLWMFWLLDLDHLIILGSEGAKSDLSMSYGQGKGACPEEKSNTCHSVFIYSVQYFYTWYFKLFQQSWGFEEI